MGQDDISSTAAVNLGLLSPRSTESPERKCADEGQERRVGRKERWTIESLKTRLAIQGHCGAPTKTSQKPCKCKIAKAKIRDVDAIVRSLIGLDEHSAGLEAELGKLVTLVHCFQHKSSNAKDSRVESWMEIFAIGEGEVYSVTMAERLIRQLLAPIVTDCMGRGEDGWCRIGGQKVHNCTETIQMIALPEAYMDDANLEFLLRVLEVNRYCLDHADRTTFPNTAIWKSRILQIRGKIDSVLVETMGRQKGDNIKAPILLASEQLFPIDFEKNPRTFWPQRYDISPFTIVASDRDQHYSQGRSYDLIKKTLEKPLEVLETRSGFLYAFEVEGNKGFVKIGYTTKCLEGRLREWTFDCNRQCKMVYPATVESARTIPHARRAEALCHAELNRFRCKVDCSACLKQHNEVFEVPTVEAIAVISKWSTWISREPYQLKTRSHKPLLNAQDLRKLDDIESFMQCLSATAL